MAHPEDIAKYKGKYDVGYEKIRLARYQKQLKMGLIDKKRYPLSRAKYQKWEKLSIEKRQREARLMDVYAAMIDCVDQNVGRLIKTLKTNGQFENTVIMFMSDNGSSNQVVRLKGGDGSIGSVGQWNSLGRNWANVGNTPFRFYKTDSYEGGINTLLIVHWSKGIKKQLKGQIFKERVNHFIDIMPTVVELSGAKYPKEFNGKKVFAMEGYSFADVLRNGDKKRPLDKVLYWQWSKGKAVRAGDWKLVWYDMNKNADSALFNMSENRTETVNVKSKYPEKLLELETLYNSWYNSLKPISDAENKKLKTYKSHK